MQSLGDRRRLVFDLYDRWEKLRAMKEDSAFSVEQVYRRVDHQEFIFIRRRQTTA